MSHINIERAHALSQQALTDKVNQMVSDLNSRLSLKCEWENDKCLIFSRKGVKGRISFAQDSLHISIQLGIMYRALKSVIEQEVNAALEGNLA